MRAAVAEVDSSEGGIDALVNNAGYGLHGPFEETTLDEIRRQFETNVFGAIALTQMVLPGMREKSFGRVLNISSVRGMLGISAGYSAYVAAKGAINSLTRQWATEWAKHGINVNAISPTFVDTPQVAMLLGDPAFKKSLTDRIPLRRVGGTDDLVGPALFFCSDASAFVTGQILLIDGGLTATQ